MKWLALLLSIVFSSFSLLQFHKTDVLLLWKVSILTTEFGQWLALITLIGLVICLLYGPSSKINLITSVFLFGATILYLWPSIEMETHQKE